MPRSLPAARPLVRPACATPVAFEHSFSPQTSLYGELYPDVERDAVCTQPAEARARIARLGHAIASLGPADSLVPVRRLVRSAFAHPCLALADLFGFSIRADSADGLRTWWNSGGHAWLRSLVDFSIHPARARITLPPTERRHLSHRAFGREPIARFLCPDEDPLCGAAAAARLRRVESLPIARDPFDLAPASATPEALTEAARLKAESCLYAIEGTPRRDRFSEWLSCMRDNRLSRRFRFAVGAYREPSGWLVLDGRFTTALSLDTGIAYQQTVTPLEHSPLVAENTAAYRTTLARMALDPERVRDFAIALVAGYYGETDTHDAAQVTVPPNVTRHRSDSYRSQSMLSESSSHAPWFRWRWHTHGCEIARGSLTDEHAHHRLVFDLLRAALRGREPVVFAQHTSALAPEDSANTVYEWAASHGTPR
ncbi:MAG: hypothetical protein JNK05_39970 [Myxococcales bacterium]|nr:hypothetical protein [Myxococcales bacterium]